MLSLDDASTVVDISAKTITTLGLILGALVGYFRYLRGRVFHAKADLVLAGQVVCLDSQKKLKDCEYQQPCRMLARVCFHFRRTRLSRYGFLLHGRNSGQTRRPRSASRLGNPRSSFLHFFTSKGESEPLRLEPGQRFVRHLLAPIPTSLPAIAFKASMSVEAIPNMRFGANPIDPWSTEFVIVRGANDG